MPWVIKDPSSLAKQQVCFTQESIRILTCYDCREHVSNNNRKESLESCHLFYEVVSFWDAYTEIGLVGAKFTRMNAAIFERLQWHQFDFQVTFFSYSFTYLWSFQCLPPQDTHTHTQINIPNTITGILLLLLCWWRKIKLENLATLSK
jgi:hypothetical protein